MRFVLISMLWLGASGCEGAPVVAPHEAPAHVEHAVPESAIATVRFAPETVTRLAIATATVEPAETSGVRLAGGEVMAPPGRTVTVSAPIAGVVSAPAGASFPVPGAHVSEGEPLVRLVPITVLDRDARARADREVAVARAALVPAVARLARLEALSADRATSVRLVEEARAARDVAQADLDAAEARARATLARPLTADVSLTVRAPFAGVVRARTVAEGQAVAPGAALVELVAADALQVRVPVYAGDLGRLDAAAPAGVRPLGVQDALALPAVPVVGPPTSDLLASTVDRYFALPAEAPFGVGERVLVELPLAVEERARRVPTSAVVVDASGGSWVYVCVDPRSFVRTRLDPLRVVGDHTLFARGPEVGACVVSVGAADVFGTEFAPGH